MLIFALRYALGAKRFENARRIGMQEKVLVVDQQKCTGCRLCELVCSVFHTGASNPSRSRVKVVKWEDVGFYLPMACNHCEQAYCVEVCPTKACHREPENNNRVTIDKKLCIGCRTCVIACPFGHPFFDVQERVTVKCDYCDGDPQCVRFCDVKAISFTDADKTNMAKKREAFLKYAESMKQVR
ncbi:MAG: 4Fe-4S dicluster domain-containing protein [Thermodesulfobacteriota bacterium]|jgi:Fe-S-cluster-containing dehydrogenase component